FRSKRLDRRLHVGDRPQERRGDALRRHADHARIRVSPHDVRYRRRYAGMVHAIHAVGISINARFRASRGFIRT
ncbi:hypothetical protein, partial [Bifidobacterium sp. UBA6881]|uniref:hypothetical protein n=1 Tax=Bifidobacterium sp. UBA6881 TaxID=1946109 RepID=UPI0025BC7A13